MEEDDPKDVLTIEDIARRLRCSKTHVCNLLRGKVEGVPTLTYMALGRRKVVRHEWLTDWMEASKRRC